MRFSLQDVKKSVQRRGGDLAVSLHFLRQRELNSEIERLIAYHESRLGQTMRQFSHDDARACIGDYRLAHCLIATLSHWYSWRPRTWDKFLQELTVSPALGDISSPVQLRLALYTYVNTYYGGFLDSQTRVSALQALAGTYQLSVSDLEYLLVLDSEEEALFVREVPAPPTAQEVATLYNQWVFESALFNASRVYFVIDCNAFGRIQQEQGKGVSGVGTGVGAVIKRLCYLARKLGVYYDLTYDTDVPSPDVPLLLYLTLYGPQEVTGAAQQYGLRLARLCRMLLGYGVARSEPGRAKKGPVLSAAIVKAEASVHFLQRAYSFNIDAQLLQLLNAQVVAEQENGNSAPLFDSGVEQLFCEAFSALAASQGVDGWQLEREPEPLLLDHSIFIPDFAFTRARHRIYVEILGFWTPAYRERKVQKLQQLQERNDLLLAIPNDAKEAYTSIAASFPIVYYDGQLSATEVLQVLRNRYDDFAARLELIDVQAVRDRVIQEGLLSERICYDVLHSYRRSELQQAAGRVINDVVLFMPGIGLYALDWSERLRSSFVQWMSEIRSATLSEVLQEARLRWPVLAMCEDATIEGLLGLWPEVQVRRASIFEAVVEMVADQLEPISVPEEEEVKKPARAKRAAVTKRNVVEQETLQGDLWG